MSDRLDWIRGACDWSDFSEDTEVFPHDETMVYMENNVSVGNAGHVFQNASALYIGRYTSIMPSCVTSPMLTIGRHCSISHNVLLGGGRHHMEYLTTGEIPGEDDGRTYDTDAQNAFAAGDHGAFTRIGCDVWIGANASVLRGRHVGTGACIGAGAVVTKDVPPYAVMVGNPARILRYRFAEPVVQSLLRTRWWTLPSHLIRTLPYKDIERCAEMLEEIRFG